MGEAISEVGVSSEQQGPTSTSHPTSHTHRNHPSRTKSHGFDQGNLGRSTAVAPPQVTVSHEPLRLGRAAASHPASNQMPPAGPIPIAFKSHIDEGESPPVREGVAATVGAVIAEALQAGTSIYLEGLGILSSRVESVQRTYIRESTLARRAEKMRRISFEKSRELTTFHRERFAPTLDTRELAKVVHAALPAELSVYGSIRATREALVDFIRTVRDEIIEHGYSAAMGAVGDFYALHNRQGASRRDWFAGADIFLVPRSERRLAVAEAQLLSRPILENAWEIIAAAYGPPLQTFEIDLLAELESLGFAPTGAEEPRFIKERTLRVAVFSNGAIHPTLTYVTEGARNLGLAHGVSVGSELTFQLPLGALQGEPHTIVPKWPSRALTLGWLLLVSARSKTVKPGVGFTADCPLIPDCDTDLTAIFTTVFNPIRAEQLTREGAFTFVNLVGITAGEAEVAARCGGDHLAALLTHRGLDQSTKPTRSAVIARTTISPRR